MEKINKLKIKFKKEKIDGYLIPKNDEFFNEYVSDDKDRLKYISNFSGSFGLALILRDEKELSSHSTRATIPREGDDREDRRGAVQTGGVGR